MRGIGFLPLKITPQLQGSLLDLDLRLLQQTQAVRKFGRQMTEFRECMDGASQPSAHGMRFVVVETVQLGLADFQDAAHIGLAGMLLDQLGIIQRRQVELLQFLDLKFQQFLARCPIRCVTGDALKFIVQFPPLPVERVHPSRQVTTSGRGIQEPPLLLRLGQLDMSMLSMNLDQALTQFLQGLQIHRTAIDVGPGPAIGVNEPAHPTFIVIGQVTLPEPIQNIRAITQIEAQVDLGSLSAGSDHA